MKKIIYSLIVAIISFTSCNDSFLEREPITDISDAKYWKSVNDLKLYTNNFYNTILPTYNGWGTIGIYGLDADKGSDTQIESTYNKAFNGERLVPQSGGGWAYSNWAQLRNINYFLDNYKRVDAPFDEAKQYVGEALFFRAYFYFEKLIQFGDLPIITAMLHTESTELFGERESRDKVAEQILKDLDMAIEYLPGKSAYTGRLTKEVAMLLQARVALYEGTWEKYHNGTSFGVKGSDGKKFMEKAATVSKALMDLGTCGLDNVGVANGYRNLFNQYDYSASKEIILWRKYGDAESLYNLWLRYTSYGAGRGLTKSMIDSYLDINGNPIAKSSIYQGDKTITDVTVNRDPRLKQTIYTPGDIQFNNTGDEIRYFKDPFFWPADENRSPTGYQTFKGHDPDYQRNINMRGMIGLIYFRYAEALLIYAEARAELGQITQNDIDLTINALRKRVGMNDGLLVMNAITPDPNWEFPELSPILNEIRRERKVELCAEGFRHEDVFRWAAAGKLIYKQLPKGAIRAQWDNLQPISEDDKFNIEALKNKVVYDTDDNGYFSPYKHRLPNGYQFKLDRDYLNPLPLSELVINKELKQNPGWDK